MYREINREAGYDQEGAATILLPAVTWFGDQLMAGRAVAEIRAELAARSATGRFTSPRRAGAAFMMSTHIVSAMTTPDGKRMMGTAPPHYMIYAPYVTNADLIPVTVSSFANLRLGPASIPLLPKRDLGSDNACQERGPLAHLFDGAMSRMRCEKASSSARV
jgi:hypothetical protein